jgi:hypothetical protein
VNCVVETKKICRSPRDRTTGNSSPTPMRCVDGGSHAACTRVSFPNRPLSAVGVKTNIRLPTAAPFGQKRTQASSAAPQSGAVVVGSPAAPGRPGLELQTRTGGRSRFIHFF